MKLNQVTVGCLDYDASVAFYKALGLIHIVDARPGYARFETATGETFSLHAVDAIGQASTIVYFETDALDERVALLGGKGLTFETQPTDQSWGWREAYLKDPAGNVICLYHAGASRRFPPWRIETETKEKGNEK